MAVRRWELRPDDWYRIWPELIGAEGAPSVPGVKRSSAAQASATDAPRPTGPAGSPASAFGMGGRREGDHQDSGFGALDTNGEGLQAEIEAHGRLTGDSSNGTAGNGG